MATGKGPRSFLGCAIFSFGCFGEAYGMQVDKGLAAAQLMDRVDSLEGLRRLVLRWPNLPDALRSSGDLHGLEAHALARFEEHLVRFYVEQFYRVAGRAPSVPYRFGG